MCNAARQEQLHRQTQTINTQQVQQAQEQQMEQQMQQQIQQQAQEQQQVQQADPEEIYQQQTAHMTETAQLGKTGFKARFSRTRTPVEAAPAPAAVQPALLRTREEATHTHSDLHSMNSRESLVEKVQRLQAAQLGDIAGAVSQYVQGTRYKVGYTQERKRLMKAMGLVEHALRRTDLSEQQRQLLNELKGYFDTMTNGTLEIPADAQVMDCTREKPQETGSSGSGSTRNKMIRAFSTWSDQRDTPLFSHEPTINDLKQRLVSNCYMVASVGGLVECDPAIIKQCLKDNGDGTVTVRLFERRVVSRQMPPQEVQEDKSSSEIMDDFEFIEEDEIEQTELVPVYVRVKKEIPRVMGGVDALSAGSLWMQMIEKACAYVGRNGSTGYQSLWYGEGGQFLERLLGIETHVDMNRNTMDEQEIEQMIQSGELFEQICHARENHVVYNAGSGHESVTGLNSGHAYTVMGGEVRDGQRLVLLRNPYSMHSLQYNEDGSRYMSDSMLSTSSDETYGQFYMKYEDFLRDFGKITHSNLNDYHE